MSETNLIRSLTAFDGVAVVAGLTIGTGIFASPGTIALLVQHVGISLVVWIIGGILAMLGGLCFAELGTVVPTTGGG